jgi:hypothetical protein
MPRFEQPGRGMVARARAIFRATRLGIAFAATAWLTGIVGVPMARGQSTTWDSMLSNSH